MTERVGMNQGDNLAEIHAWIDEIPFSRPKKNIPRDFSDGVLMAEVLKAYFPRYVDVHNYIPASNVAAKRDNWITLNRKVLSKIDLKLSKEVINQLANSQQGVIEKVLIELRSKVEQAKEPNSSLYEEDKEDKEEESIEGSIDADLKHLKSPEVLDEVIETPSSEVPGSKNVVGKACGWLAGWMWPLSVVSKNSDKDNPQEEAIIASEKPADKADSNGEDEVEPISHLDLLRLRQEVREKNAAINVLNRRVSCLESAMKLKDQKIGNLTDLISNSESAQNLRPHVMGSSISRLRSKTRKVNLCAN